jgi:hypothetical protein
MNDMRTISAHDQENKGGVNSKFGKYPGQVGDPSLSTDIPILIPDKDKDEPVPHPNQRVPLAYENKKSLNGLDGRILRILAEYQEPLSKFRRERRNYPPVCDRRNATRCAARFFFFFARTASARLSATRSGAVFFFGCACAGSTSDVALATSISGAVMVTPLD